MWYYVKIYYVDVNSINRESPHDTLFEKGFEFDNRSFKNIIPFLPRSQATLGKPIPWKMPSKVKSNGMDLIILSYSGFQSTRKVCKGSSIPRNKELCVSQTTLRNEMNCVLIDETTLYTLPLHPTRNKFLLYIMLPQEHFGFAIENSKCQRSERSMKKKNLLFSKQLMAEYQEPIHFANEITKGNEAQVIQYYLESKHKAIIIVSEGKILFCIDLVVPLSCSIYRSYSSL